MRGNGTIFMAEWRFTIAREVGIYIYILWGCGRKEGIQKHQELDRQTDRQTDAVLDI